jgi:Terminase small subunit
LIKGLDRARAYRAHARDRFRRLHAEFDRIGSLLILLAMGRLRNPKRERFAIEVASMTPVDRAYVLAGYCDSQWARPNGSRLAHEPEVAKRIQELRDEFRASAALSVEYLQRLLLPVAEANVLDFLKFENDKLVPKNLSELKREHTAALAAIKVDEEGKRPSFTRPL